MGVVWRLVPSDEPGLKHERLGLAVRRRDPAHVLYRAEEVLHLLALIPVEVGPHAGTEVDGLAHVQHLPGPILEQVDAGGPGKQIGQTDLAEVRSPSRGARLAEVSERADPQPAAELDQAVEDFGGCLRVGEGAVDRDRTRPEVAGERREPHVRYVRPHDAPREPGGADRRPLERVVVQAQQVGVQEPEVERRVVSDEDRAARELEEAGKDLLDLRRARDEQFVDAGQLRDVRRDRLPWVHEGLEGGQALAAPIGDGSDLGDGMVGG